jgi:cysteine synthase
MNPSGSIKDRAALWIIERAERKGMIKKGGPIVEGTSGNTGIALAMISACKGYKCIICLPDYVS